MATLTLHPPTAREAREDLDRLREQERAAAAAGFSLKPPIFALGTRVNAIGVENFKRSRLAFEALPPAREALAALVARVEAEERRDVAQPVRRLRMLPSGELENARGTSRALLSGPSFRQLLARSACPEPGAAATYLATIPPDRRAREVNAWLETTPEDRIAVLRTRETLGPIPAGAVDIATRQPVGAPAAREVYAVVSEDYRAGFEVGTVARLLADVAPGDARAELEYDGNRARLVLSWHSDIQPERACAGEVFRASAGLETRDDGGASLEPFAGLVRNLCLNLIILDENTIKLGKKRHTGDARSIARFLHEALREAVNHVRAFAMAWDGARADRLDVPGAIRDLPATVAPGSLRSIAGAFRGLLKTGVLGLPGYRGEAAVSELSRAYQAEPEPTRAGIVNAITRAAHTSELRGPWATAELEAAGGRVLGSKRPLVYVERGDDF